MGEVIYGEEKCLKHLSCLKMNRKIRIVILIEDCLLKENLINKIVSNKNYEIAGAFDDGIKCLKYMLNNECDLFIIDFMLTNIDGLGLISKLRKNNPNVFKKLICISDFDLMIFDILKELSIDYCLRKPFNLDYFMEIIKRMTYEDGEDAKNNHDKIIKNELNKIFAQFGMPCHLKGHNYLLTGICDVYNNINLLNEVTKELYPNIARKYGTTASRVEQAIRHVIKVTWVNGNKNELEKFFGIRAKKRPCNSEFISKMADILLSHYY